MFTSTHAFGSGDTRTVGAPRRRPSRLVRVVLAPLTHVFNPLVRSVAGRRHVGMAARLHHAGRVSGRVFVTPVSAREHDRVIWIPLTFGAGSDWCRNVRHAGRCLVQWKGTLYEAANPALVTRADALRAAGRAFKPHERAMLRVLGVEEFVRLDVVAS